MSRLRLVSGICCQLIRIATGASEQGRIGGAPLIRARLDIGEPHSLAAFWTANTRDCRVLLLGRTDCMQPMRNFVRVVRDALAQFVATRQLQRAMLHVQIFFLGDFVKRVLGLRAAVTGALIAPRCLMIPGL